MTYVDNGDAGSDFNVSLYSKVALKRLAIAGALVLACGLAFTPLRIWSNLLVGSFYLLTTALGGALFVALTYVTGGGWHVAFRRIPEAMAMVLPAAGVAMLVVLSVRMSQYGWHHDWHGDAGTFWFKELWLTPSFWLARVGVYVLLSGSVSTCSSGTRTSQKRRLTSSPAPMTPGSTSVHCAKAAARNSCAL